MSNEMYQSNEQEQQEKAIAATIANNDIFQYTAPNVDTLASLNIGLPMLRDIVRKYEAGEDLGTEVAEIRRVLDTIGRLEH